MWPTPHIPQSAACRVAGVAGLYTEFPGPDKVGRHGSRVRCAGCVHVVVRRACKGRCDVGSAKCRRKGLLAPASSHFTRLDFAIYAYRLLAAMGGDLRSPQLGHAPPLDWIGFPSFVGPERVVAAQTMADAGEASQRGNHGLAAASQHECAHPPAAASASAALAPGLAADLALQPAGPRAVLGNAAGRATSLNSQMALGGMLGYALPTSAPAGPLLQQLSGQEPLRSGCEVPGAFGAGLLGAGTADEPHAGCGELHPGGQLGSSALGYCTEDIVVLQRPDAPLVFVTTRIAGPNGIKASSESCRKLARKWCVERSALHFLAVVLAGRALSILVTLTCSLVRHCGSTSQLRICEAGLMLIATVCRLKKVHEQEQARGPGAQPSVKSLKGLVPCSFAASRRTTGKVLAGSKRGAAAAKRLASRAGPAKRRAVEPQPRAAEPEDHAAAAPIAAPGTSGEPARAHGDAFIEALYGSDSSEGESDCESDGHVSDLSDGAGVENHAAVANS